MFKVGDEVVLPLKIEKICNEELVGAKSEADVTYLFKIEEANRVLKPRESKTYTQGLADAWELADKLNNMPLTDIIELFGIDIAREEVFKEISPQEALAKIEAYEKEKEIKVKTIVETHDGSHKGVVTLVREKGDFFVLWDNGTSDTYEKHEVKNTGKTAESLDLLLRQIGE